MSKPIDQRRAAETNNLQDGAYVVSRFLPYNAIPHRVQADYNGGVHFDWDRLETAITPGVPSTSDLGGFVGSLDGTPPDLYPDFQRGHVWTLEQRIAWTEYKLEGGHGSDLILWNEDLDGHYVLVDGLQRLTSALMFVRDEFRVFRGFHESEDGWRYSEISPAMKRLLYLRFTINRLETRAEVLGWYLELNAGGTPHSDEEIKRVRELLHRERSDRPDNRLS